MYCTVENAVHPRLDQRHLDPRADYNFCKSGKRVAVVLTREPLIASGLGSPSNTYPYRE